MTTAKKLVGKKVIISIAWKIRIEKLEIPIAKSKEFKDLEYVSEATLNLIQVHSELFPSQPDIQTHNSFYIHSSYWILERTIYSCGSNQIVKEDSKNMCTSVAHLPNYHPSDLQPGDHCYYFLHILLDILHQHTTKHFNVVSLSSFLTQGVACGPQCAASGCIHLICMLEIFPFYRESSHSFLYSFIVVHRGKKIRTHSTIPYWWKFRTFFFAVKRNVAVTTVVIWCVLNMWIMP